MFTSHWIRKLVNFDGGKHITVNKTIAESIEGEIHGGVVFCNPWRVLSWIQNNGRQNVPK
jgi:hypothetical protein